MKLKIAAGALVLAVLLTLCAACGRQTPSSGDVTTAFSATEPTEQGTDGPAPAAQEQDARTDTGAEAVAAAIAAHTELFEEEMASVPSARALSLFGVEPDAVAECAYYAASAAVAEEILVVKLADGASADPVLAGIEGRKASQIEDYSDYVPKEVTKIENAVTVTKGDWVVFCVSGDSDAAAAAIDGLI